MNKIKILVIPKIIKSLSKTWGKVDVRSTAIKFAEDSNYDYIEVPHLDYNVTSVYTIAELRAPNIRIQGDKDGKPFRSKYPNSPPYFLHCMPWKGNGDAFTESNQKDLFGITDIERLVLKGEDYEKVG